MTTCPICDAPGYRWREGCGDCGHVDEDRIAIEKRHETRQRRRNRRAGHEF